MNLSCEGQDLCACLSERRTQLLALGLVTCLCSSIGSPCRACRSRLPPAAVCLFHAAVRARAMRESKVSTHPGSAFLRAWVQGTPQSCAVRLSSVGCEASLPLACWLSVHGVC